MPIPQSTPGGSPELRPLPKITDKDRLTRRGTYGTEYYSGYFSEEYNSDWRDEQRAIIVEKMRRGDSTVAAMLNAVKTPIKAADWYIQAYSEDEKDQEIAEEVKRQLWGLHSNGFCRWLSETLAYLDFGHYVYEKMWKQTEDGMIVLHDLAARIPKSIVKWETTDGLPGITQYVKSDQQYEEDRRRVNNPSIPMNKLVVFTHQKEGSDITGVSILRPVYSDWYYKTELQRIQAISLERFGVGILDISHDTGIGDKEKAKLEDMAQNIYANEQSYMLHMDNVTVDIKSPQNNGNNQFLDTIKYYDRKILLSMLAQFLDLGSGESGSFALSKDQSDFFMQELEDIAKYVCEQVDKHIVKEIVDLNYPEAEGYPTLKFSPLGSVSHIVLAELSKAGLLHKDPELLQFVRKVFRLPEMSEEEMEKIDIANIESEIDKV